MARKGPESHRSSQLLAWYDANARVLPWRSRPGEQADPYRVWLSEIMLQQTTVQAVKAYFEKFVALWRSVEALAAAPLDDVLKAWAGLGYYARARNLHACAKDVVARFGGRFPDTEAELRSLPGIGPYTAGAIAAIAFGGRHAAVDGNVERVISRIYAIETPLPDSKPEIREKTQALVPVQRAGDFAQAMMDLGATICTPRDPNCLICPWTEHCAGRITGLAPTLPRKKPKKAVPTRRGIAFWIERADGAVLLRRRPEKGLLGGMMEVPSTVWGATVADAEPQAPLAAEWKKLPGTVEHTFTHFHLELTVWKSEAISDGVLRDDGDYRWTKRQEIDGEALPTVMRKVVAHVLPHMPSPRRKPGPSFGRKPRGKKAGSRLSPG
ncbi:MAG: A/G-specific adenine glycosylase [Aestuariivirga sp.]|uniref:A/G-specific adenine glycosylase n=1 Tax=Aestuariivirga sp. TaxID=2650926 RepID=UPI00301B1854